MKKFEFTGENKTVKGVVVRRIRATRYIGRYDIKPGMLGGWLHEEGSLDNDDDSWVFGGAVILADVRIGGDSALYDSTLSKVTVVNSVVVSSVIDDCAMQSCTVISSAVKGGVRMTASKIASCDVQRGGVIENSTLADVELAATASLRYATLLGAHREVLKVTAPRTLHRVAIMGGYRGNGGVDARAIVRTFDIDGEVWTYCRTFGDKAWTSRECEVCGNYAFVTRGFEASRRRGRARAAALAIAERDIIKERARNYNEDYFAWARSIERQFDTDTESKYGEDNEREPREEREGVWCE